jgi:hypothetical protein
VGVRRKASARKMTTQRVKLGVLGLLGALALSYPLCGQQSSSAPADPKLKIVYQRLHFDRQYPAEAVAFIQEKLQNVPRAVDGLADLAKDGRPNVRILVATLMGELGKADGAKTLWDLTRDDTEFVRTAAAGAIVQLARLTPVVASLDGLKDQRPDVRQLTVALLGQVADKSVESALIGSVGTRTHPCGRKRSAHSACAEPARPFHHWWRPCGTAMFSCGPPPRARWGASTMRRRFRRCWRR